MPFVGHIPMACAAGLAWKAEVTSGWRARKARSSGIQSRCPGCRVPHGAACSARIRPTSRMTAGWSWHRWPDVTSDSDAIPWRWALSYGTRPSLPPAPGGWRRSAMMEWALTVGVKPSSSRPTRIGDCHSNSSMLVGRPLRKRSVKKSGPLRARSRSCVARSGSGKRTSREPSARGRPGRRDSRGAAWR